MSLNNRGLYGFFIVLAFAAIYTGLIAENARTNEAIAKTKNKLLEAEKLNTLRTIAEENIDRAIKEKLEEQLRKTTNESTVKTEINNTLLQLLEKLAETYSENPQMEFSTGNGDKISKEFLEKNSKALVIDTETGTKKAEYYIISGFGGTIKGKHFEQEIMIPTGYTVKATVIR